MANHTESTTRFSSAAARLRRWSDLWNRYNTGDRLDVSGQDALAALRRQS